MTNEPRIYKGEKIVSSINGAGKTRVAISLSSGGRY